MGSAWDSIDAVYIIGHPKFEKVRIDRVLDGLRLAGCPREKIALACRTWGSQLSAQDCFGVYDPYLPRQWPCLNFKCRWLLKGEISLVLNFHGAVLDAVEKGHKCVMVLESDVRFRWDFSQRFDALMKKAVADSSWSYISLSDGVGTHSQGCEFGQWYGEQQLLPPNPAQQYFPFRCTDSMIFCRDFLEHLKKHLLPFRDCLDWELNFQLAAFRGKALWAEPHLIEQATQKRLELGSLRH